MATRSRQRFVRGQIAIMVAAILLLSAFNTLSLELFFIVSLVGFLTLIEFTASVNVTPHWRRRLKWFILLGVLGFAVIIGRRLLEVVPPGVF